MKCPSCGHPSNHVKDSRKFETFISRRRSCNICSHRFSTYEYIDGRMPKKFLPMDHLNQVRKSLLAIEEVIRQYQKSEIEKTQPIKTKERE
jgi:transcriptional regulator NrdR family protein